MSRAPGDLGAAEQKLLAGYNLLTEVLTDHREELAPFEERNALKAAAALWQVMNGLDLDPDHLYDLGA